MARLDLLVEGDHHREDAGQTGGQPAVGRATNLVAQGWRVLVAIHQALPQLPGHVVAGEVVAPGHGVARPALEVSEDGAERRQWLRGRLDAGQRSGRAAEPER